MAESALTEDTRIPLKFALYLGGIALVGLLAFTKVQSEVNTLQQRADQNDVRDAASVADRQQHALQLQELRITLKNFGDTLQDVRDDVRDVKKSTVPADGTVRAGGRR